MAMMTIDEVSQMLRVSPSWVYRAVAAGKISCLRVGSRLRFDPALVVSELKATPRHPTTPGTVTSEGAAAA